MIQKMKLYATTGVVSFLSATQAFANAAVDFGGVPDVGKGNLDIRTAVIDVLNTVLSFLALIAVVVIVIAGIRLVVGGADDGQREKARNAILWAIVGLIVVLLASAIVNFVLEL